MPHVRDDDRAIAHLHLRAVALADADALGESECGGEPGDGLAHVRVDQDGDDGALRDRPVRLHGPSSLDRSHGGHRGTATRRLLERAGHASGAFTIPARAPARPGHLDRRTGSHILGYPEQFVICSNIRLSRFGPVPPVVELALV